MLCVQASDMSAYNGLELPIVQQLVPLNHVREAKRKIVADTQQECHNVIQHLGQLGIRCDQEAIAHALLPLPDQPFLTCLANLRRPGAHIPAAGSRRAGKGTSRKKHHHVKQHKKPAAASK